VADGVRCLAFYNGETASAKGTFVLAAWDDAAPPEGRPHSVPLGRARREIDLWGQSTPLHRDDHGRPMVRLSAMPIFIDDVEGWLIDFITSITLNPAHVESGMELVRHTVELSLGGSRAINIQGSFATPDSISVTPRTFSLDILPGRKERITFEARYAHNEPAGRKMILARMTLSEGPYDLEIPLPVDIGLTEVGVSGMAAVDGDDLVLRHVVSNRSSSVLSFRGSAGVPGRERQYRPLSNLHPGDTQTVVYRFRDGAGLVGRRVLLGLREMNDGPRVHNLELTVP